MKETKTVTVLFGIGLAGIVLCFMMTVLTAIQQHHQKTVAPESSSHAVAVPAVGGG